MFLLKQKVPSRKLTYPIPRHFEKDFPFPQVRYVSSPKCMYGPSGVWSCLLNECMCLTVFSPLKACLFTHIILMNMHQFFLVHFLARFFLAFFSYHIQIYIYISCFYIYRRVYTTLLSSLTITTFESPKRLRHRRSWSRNAGMILRRNRWSHNGWRMKSHWFFVTTLR